MILNTGLAWHELGHAVLAVGSGARLEVIKIDPNEGGIITVTGGVYPLAAVRFLSDLIDRC